MSKSVPPRVVVVTRRTDYQRVLERHATAGQARFFLQSRGQSLDALAEAHQAFESALHRVLGAVPLSWRRTRIERDGLDRFLFEPEDLVVAVGQDGLVANVAKYLRHQCVIGINPLPASYDGVLVRHAPAAIDDLLHDTVAGRCRLEARAMVRARLDDGLELRALNEIFVGHQSHQSARYRIAWQGRDERHSSSGVIATSGTGATGWARSIHMQRRTDLELPTPTDPRLAFFVREAFPSRATGTTLVEGLIDASQTLVLTSEMNEGGVIFGDGIEADRIEFSWGRRVTVGLSEERLQLVV